MHMSCIVNSYNVNHSDLKSSLLKFYSLSVLHSKACTMAKPIYSTAIILFKQQAYTSVMYNNTGIWSAMHMQ